MVMLMMLVKAKLVQVPLADDDCDDSNGDGGDDDDDDDDSDDGNDDDDDDYGDDGDDGDDGEGQTREGVPLHGNCLQRVLVPPS